MILDSSALVDFLDPETDHHEDVRSYIEDRPTQPWFSPTIVLFELYQYRARQAGRDGVADLAERLDWVDPLEFTEPAAREAAVIDAELMADGNPINMMDVLIAGVARSVDMALLARDGDFERIAGLDVEYYAATDREASDSN
ncbi:PIN domain-containing protein [Natronococcus sp. A-GB1]|uniref:PIN domain-containing protein n=1 Tax=Natronococcus sp. A-GB1 TaxID=3037648 RepID=UPI00241E71D7|nr:PIN domain-containing protein [Natronococcus sp. A-GB1]MDG5759998.1 PIN domain-containing protein [Natronococcus sp. A-GB1]